MRCSMLMRTPISSGLKPLKSCLVTRPKTGPSRGVSACPSLHDAGHLHAAGPLLDRTSPFRGLSILSVGVEDAIALKERDPAVQAGRYRIIALPWLVPAGAIAFSPATFPRSVAEATGT
jgi:hypothetical protein